MVTQSLKLVILFICLLATTLVMFSSDGDTSVVGDNQTGGGSGSGPKCVGSLASKAGPLSATEYHRYVDPCLTKIPYGTRTAGWRYMEQIGALNNKLYADCNKYGCPASGSNKAVAPSMECTIGQGQAKVNPDRTIASDTMFGGAEQFHNSEEYCRNNPWDRRCSNNSAHFSVFTAEAHVPMDECPAPVQATMMSDSANVNKPPGFCLEGDSTCNVGDTRAITVIQPQKLLPCPNY